MLSKCQSDTINSFLFFPLSVLAATFVFCWYLCKQFGPRWWLTIKHNIQTIPHSNSVPRSFVEKWQQINTKACEIITSMQRVNTRTVDSQNMEVMDHSKSSLNTPLDSCKFLPNVLHLNEFLSPQNGLNKTMNMWIKEIFYQTTAANLTSFEFWLLRKSNVIPPPQKWVIN